MPEEMKDSTPGAGRETHPAGGAFVGRDHELTALSASLASIAAGGGRLDIVSGAPGTGKTRLAQEFAAMAEAEGFRVLRASCWDGDGAPPFWPWIQALRDILGDSTSNGSMLAAPELHGLLQRALAARGVDGLAAFVESSDAQQARFNLFDRFATLLRDLAEEQPLAIVVDDVHRADSGSILLLQFLAGRLADAPMAVCVTSRDPVPPLITNGCRHPWSRQFVLTGLSRSEVCTLLEARAGEPPKSELVDRLMALTDGNPFYLRELGHVLTADADSMAMLSLPPSLAGIAMHQFDALSPPCRTLLQAASVIGREFDADVVAAACGLATGAALDLLQEALAHRVVARSLPMRYRFADALVREGTYDRLHSSERTHLHERVAAVLEERLGTPVEVSFASIAHHAFLGLPRTDRVKAAMFAVAAGREAHAACAYEEAVALFHRAKELIDTHSTDSDACDLLLLLGAAQAAAGEWVAARRTFEDAASRARHTNDAPRFARAALGFKGLMSGTLPVDSAAVSMLEEANHRLGENHAAVRVEVLSALSRSLYFAGDPSSVDLYSNHALRLSAELCDDRLRGIALEARSLAQWQPLLVEDLHDTATDLLRIGTHAHEPLLSFHARLLRFWTNATRGSMPDADAELLAASQIADGARHPRLNWQVALLCASRAIARGDAAAVAHWHSLAQSLGQRVHDASPTQHHLAQSFYRNLLASDLLGWDIISDQICRRYPTVIAYRAGLALVHARLGHDSAAGAILKPFIISDFTSIPLNNLTLFIYALLAEALAITENTEGARLLYPRLLPFAHYQVVAGWGTVLGGSVSRLLGLLADASNDTDAAALHLSNALRFDSLLDSPVLAARTAVAYARHLCRHSNPSSLTFALDLVRQASSAYFEAGLPEAAADAHSVAATIAARANGAQSTRALRSESTSHLLPQEHDYSLTRHGDFWILVFQGTTAQLKHTLGLSYICHILSARGTPLHVLDLTSRFADSRTHVLPGLPDTLLDAQARNQYKGRMRELASDIEAAEVANDLGLLARLRTEHEALLDHLSASLGLSGRARRAPHIVERARIAVRNRISVAISRLQGISPSAWSHLRHSIRTGTFCSYTPDRPTHWHT